MRFPQTLFARAFLLIVVLILLSLSSALAIFRYVQQEPRAQQMAQMVVAVVNLTRAAMLSAAPEWHSALLAELGDAEGLRVSMAEPNEVLQSLPEHHAEWNLMMQKVRARLGDNTRFAVERNQVRALWVSFFIGHEEFWVAVPMERIERSFSQVLMIWGSVVLVLAMLGAYFIARQVSRPLKQLAHAAQQLGRGNTPQTLPENGAQEIAAVSHAFNQMSSDIAANERERALVLAGISHDLRTPLTRVRLAAEMSSDEALRAGLTADVAQMDEVIQQFLDYARLDEHEAAVPTDVTQLVREVAQRYEASALTLDIQPALHWSVRPLLLKRALNNLLDNAVKYGGGEIVVRLEQAGDSMMLSVSDNGSGIASEQRDLAKRPFVRLQAARSDTTGAGLGLAIVERAARLHGGELVLAQSGQGGLRAELVLPESSRTPYTPLVSRVRET
jgi:two-component system osmolarity sensor histidine kinase EnvZ